VKQSLCHSLPEATVLSAVQTTTQLHCHGYDAIKTIWKNTSNTCQKCNNLRKIGKNNVIIIIIIIILFATAGTKYSSSSSSSSSDAKRSAEASRRCDCSPERSVLR